jgi:hypothetical protein
MSKAKQESGREVSRKAIEPFIKHAQVTRGFIADVARQLSVQLRGNIHPEQVRQWLDPKEENRIEPRLGIGLALLSACAQVSARK